MNSIGRSADLTSINALYRKAGDYERNGCHAEFGLERGQLVAAVQILFDQGFFLEDISGVDVTEGILLLYHFDRYDMARRVVLKLTVAHKSKKVPSIEAIFSGANWHERECFDFFGVEFENHPSLKPLLLPDDLGFSPLLKNHNRRSLYSLLPLDQAVSGRME
jgi:NADH-quinone oxidoreductase subunit C